MNHKSIGHVTALVTILIWGTTFISTKLLLKSFQPVEILFFRFTLGTAALFIVYPHRLKTNGLRQELLFIGAGFCGVTLYYLLENIALTYSTASNVGVIISTAPFFTGVLSRCFLKEEKLHPAFFIGFLCAIAGIALLSFGGETAFRLSPVGDLLALAAAAVWAAYSVLTRKIGSFGYHPVAATRRTFLYGLVFMVPALFIFGFRFGPERFTDPVNLFNLLFLGLFASAMCFVTWNFSVKAIGAVRTSAYIYLVPVITVATSVLVLKERITPLSGLGIALTLFGLVISERKSPQQAHGVPADVGQSDPRP